MTSPESIAEIRRRLRAFLAVRNTGAEDIRIDMLERSGHGSSRENWPFDATWKQAGSLVRLRLLLRRDPPHAVVDTGRSTEFALLKALEQTPVPAPVAYWLDDDGTELVRPGMIVHRYPGRAHRAALREKNPLCLSIEDRARLAEQLCDLLALVHRVDLAATGLRDVLPAPLPDPATAEVDRWEILLDRAELEPQPVLRWTLRWLRDHLPAPPERLTLVHGDFRPANVLVHEGTVRVLLDWELAHLGDPLDDLGWYCAPIYTHEHFIPGVWEQSDFLTRYTDLTGLRVSTDAQRFWQVLSLFRLAVIALRSARNFCAAETDRPAAPPTTLLRLLADIVSGHPGKV